MNIKKFINIICPEHDRTSCGDKDPCNQGRCGRCTLLHIEREGKLPEGTTIPYIPCENKN